MSETQNLPSLLPSKDEFNMFQVMARNAQASGLYGGVGGEAKIFMVLLAARELGISPMLALNGGIWNIQGKIEVSARLMNAMIRRAGHSITVKKSDDTECILVGKRTDGDTFECSFTIEDATKAGLAGRDVWKKYASDMLYNRCMSRLARRLFPDVIGTAYIEGEIRDAKDLPQAECEDVTIPSNCNAKSDNRDTTICHNEVDTTNCQESPVVKIDEPMALAMLKVVSKLSSDNEKLFYSTIKNYGASTVHEIPIEKFKPAMSWINIMLDKQKNEDKV